MAPERRSIRGLGIRRGTVESQRYSKLANSDGRAGLLQPPTLTVSLSSGVGGSPLGSGAPDNIGALEASRAGDLG